MYFQFMSCLYWVFWYMLLLRLFNLLNFFYVVFKTREIFSHGGRIIESNLDGVAMKYTYVLKKAKIKF